MCLKDVQQGKLFYCHKFICSINTFLITPYPIDLSSAISELNISLSLMVVALLPLNIPISLRFAGFIRIYPIRSLEQKTPESCWLNIRGIMNLILNFGHQHENYTWR